MAYALGLSSLRLSSFCTLHLLFQRIDGSLPRILQPMEAGGEAATVRGGQVGTGELLHTLTHNSSR